MSNSLEQAILFLPTLLWIAASLQRIADEKEKK